MVTTTGSEWVDVSGAWKNPEIRLERWGSTSREGPGTLTQRPPGSGCSPLPHLPPPPPGCLLKPGGGFDLGSARLSAGRPGALGEGRRGRPSPPGLPLPRPPAPRPLPPPPGKETVSGCCRRAPEHPDSTPCSCSPAARPHPKDSWERGWGRGAGRSCSAPGLGPGRAAT